MKYKTVQGQEPIEAVRSFEDPLQRMGIVTQHIALQLGQAHPGEIFRPEVCTYGDGKGIDSDYTAYAGAVSRHVSLPRWGMGRLLFSGDKKRWLASLYVLHSDSEDTESELRVEVENSDFFRDVEKIALGLCAKAGLPIPEVVLNKRGAA